MLEFHNMKILSRKFQKHLIRMFGSNHKRNFLSNVQRYSCWNTTYKNWRNPKRQPLEIHRSSPVEKSTEKFLNYLLSISQVKQLSHFWRNDRKVPQIFPMKYLGTLPEKYLNNSSAEFLKDFHQEIWDWRNCYKKKKTGRFLRGALVEFFFVRSPAGLPA